MNSKLSHESKTAYIEGKLLKRLALSLIKFQTMLVSGHLFASFYHGFVLNKTQFDAGFSERMTLKDDAV